ncbi:hypothetical protein N7532_005048 [Penicillium argentinense]|uniref:ASST-domain-containing protein n=1 Tax=Penicillium argentinense TaxID=1131581 RepID=A0A9W9FDQ9_9EURO|nr:uncharacterized protein N7532_005048 [Penicillium argentinense]KAJ5098047.1 hypothetical protein N7532_005048 [Penicillium argentinense]
MRGTLFLTAGALLLNSLGAATETNWPYASFKTGPWEPPQLALNKTDGVDPGLIFIPIRNENTAGTAVTIYDNDGHFVYQGPEEATMDFRVQKLFDEDVLTFWSGEVEVAGGYGYGKVHILDKTYREIHTITLTDNFVTATGETRDSYIDVHEHQITDRNTILVSAINVTQHNLTSLGGPSDAWMTVSHFYEIDILTKEILFTWNALDHQDKIPLSSSRQRMQAHPVQATPWDAYHMNSVTPTNDGYLISMRFYWSAFYLNKDGTVRWQLSGDGDGDGDFTGEDVRFTWQHHIRVYNETDESLVLSVFNNANSQSQSQSETTGMVFDVDLTNMSGSMLYNLSDPTDAIYTKTQGSFEFLGEAATTSNMFIGYGSDPQVKEYNGKGDVVLSAQFGARTHAMSYRAFKSEWKATPFWNPAAVVDDDTVYMSWNGATEYDNWAIYSIPSLGSNATKLMTTHKRTGFETNVSIADLDAKYITVAARRGNTVLRFSDAVEV